MKKNLSNYVNKLLINKDNIFYLFKKKKFKKIFLLNKKKNLNIIKILKILILFNIYRQDYYVNFFFYKYNLIKNF